MICTQMNPCKARISIKASQIWRYLAPTPQDRALELGSLSNSVLIQLQKQSSCGSGRKLSNACFMLQSRFMCTLGHISSLHLLNCVLVYVNSELAACKWVSKLHVHRKGYVDEHGLKLLRRRFEHDGKGWFIEKSRSQSGEGAWVKVQSWRAWLLWLYNFVKRQAGSMQPADWRLSTFLFSPKTNVAQVLSLTYLARPQPRSHQYSI